MSNYTNSGWSNNETWSLNLRYEGVFQNMAEEQEYDDVEHMADSFESLVNELEFDGLRENSLAHEVLGLFLDRVDWTELAEHHFVEKVEEADEDNERYEAMARRLEENN
jgi:hypothetical protein